MITLKQAIEQGKLDEFTAAHGERIGDADVFEATLKAMAGKSKEAPAASSPDDCDD